MNDYTPPLGAKRRTFVEEYLRCLNATQAARLANYKCPDKQGPRLLKVPRVASAIKDRLSEMRENTDDHFRSEIEQNVKRAERHLSANAYLYLIRADNGLVKIGIAANIRQRISVLNTQSPIPLSLVASIHVCNARKLESWLHEAYKDKRVRGEWFSLSAGDIRDITVIANRREWQV